MPFYVKKNGSWVAVNESSATTNRIYARKSNAWRMANEVYVKKNGVWKNVYTRIPAVPTSVSMTVNDSSSSNITVTSSPLNVESFWSVQSYDSGLPIRVRYYLNGSWDGVDHNLAAGTTYHQKNISISQGQSRNINAYVQVRNNAVYSPIGSSNVITVSWANPTINAIMMQVFDYNTDDIYVSWTVSNAPANVGYIVSYSINYGGWFTISGPPGQTALNTTISAAMHGYDLVNYFTGNSVTIGVEIHMYSNFNIIASQTTYTSFNTTLDQ